MVQRQGFISTAKAIGMATSPVNKSAPARQARSMLELVRSGRLQGVATAKMTSAFKRTVGRNAIELTLAKATECLYVPSVKYSLRQTNSLM